MFKAIIYVFITLTMVCANSLIAQVPDYLSTNYTIDQGLPSNECHSVVTDAHGYVWIATDRGLSRWDGYKFKNYGVREGLEDVSIFNLYKDTNDDIWIITYSAKLYIYKQATGKIIPYKFNDIYSFYRKKINHLSKIWIDESGKVYLYFNFVNILTISKEGCVEIIQNGYNFQNFDLIRLDNRDVLNFDIFDNDGFIKPINNRMPFVHQLNWAFIMPFEKLGIKSSKDVNSGVNTVFDKSFFQLNDNSILVYYAGRVFHYGNNKVISSRNCAAIKDLLVTKQGEIYTAEIFKGGVKYYKDINAYMADVFTTVFPNVSASRLTFDDNDGIWVATLEDGVIHLRKNNFKKIALSDNIIKKVTEVEIGRDGSIYVVNNDATLLKLDLKHSISSTIITAPTEIVDFSLDNDSQQIIVNSKITMVINGDKRTTLQYRYYYDDNKIANGFEAKKAIWTKNNQIYLINNDGVFIFDKNLTNLNPACMDKRQPRKVLFAISPIDECSYLVGGIEGLELYKDGRYTSLFGISALFATRVNEIINRGTTHYIATQGQGLLVVDDLLGLNPKIKRYNQSQGILSDNIENITVDEKGNIYLSTFAGFNILRPDTLLKDYKIKAYTSAHGLPSNEVNDIAVYDDKVYIATGGGLVLLNDSNESKTISRSPVIENIQVNNIAYKVNQLPSKFNYYENNIILDYKKIDLNLNGNVLYRYGFDQDDLEETYATSVNYNDLGSGKYTFYVQAMDRDQRWSDYTTVSFIIDRPWWKSPYFLIGLLIGILGLGYVYFRRRISAIHTKNEVALELISLERSALQAQMNPHFIFNCLNSIQNYIMKNDKEMAMEFLNKFAHLIRQTLNLSASSLVTLEEEINVLENYLALEQMRFRDKFTYEINLLSDINTQQIKFPPLLLQPFVENAIIHGINTATKNAKIIINISQTETHLVISILDNGIGTRHNTNKHKYKSMGMNITRKRLNFVNKYAGEHYTVTPRESDAGTEVIVKLLLKEVNFESV